MINIQIWWLGSRCLTRICKVIPSLPGNTFSNSDKYIRRTNTKSLIFKSVQWLDSGYLTRPSSSSRKNCKLKWNKWIIFQIQVFLMEVWISTSSWFEAKYFCSQIFNSVNVKFPDTYTISFLMVTIGICGRIWCFPVPMLYKLFKLGKWSFLYPY